MIASKKPLKLVKYEGPQDEPTPEERFRKKYKMRLPLVLQNSQGATQEASNNTFTVTGSPMKVGESLRACMRAIDCEDVEWLMSVPHGVFQWPDGMKSRSKMEWYAQGIPCNFGKQLAAAVLDSMEAEGAEMQRESLVTARATVLTAGEGDLEPFEGETTERVNCNEKYVPWSARFENAACGNRIGN